MSAAPLPHRDGPGGVDPWRWFVALARQSKSGSELLESVLRRPLMIHPLRHRDRVPVVAPPALRSGEAEAEADTEVDAVALDEYLLLGADFPHPTLGLSSALVLPARLPRAVGQALERRTESVDRLLEISGSFWTSETLELTELTVDGASFPAERAPDTRMLRLTRRLSLIGTPVAVIVEEIPLPPLPAGGPVTPMERAHF
jgi:hypothetical protein